MYPLRQILLQSWRSGIFGAGWRRQPKKALHHPAFTNLLGVPSSGLPVGGRNPVWHILHTPAQGARASLQAVTTDLPGGTYLAPRFNQWGRPRVTGLRKKARDPVAARRLWELSAELTGCDWP